MQLMKENEKEMRMSNEKRCKVRGHGSQVSSFAILKCRKCKGINAEKGGISIYQEVMKVFSKAFKRKREKEKKEKKKK